jgi:hypothetical protein
MLTFPKFLIAAAGCATVTLCIALVTPRRSEAQFASPVRVMNTAQQGVPVTPGGTPFTHTFLQSSLANGQFGASDGFIASVSQNLVIDTFNYMAVTKASANVQNALGAITCTSNGVSATMDFGSQRLVQIFGPEDALIVNAPGLKLHCDANKQILVVLQFAGASDGSYNVSYTLTGLLQ